MGHTHTHTRTRTQAHTHARTHATAKHGTHKRTEANGETSTDTHVFNCNPNPLIADETVVMSVNANTEPEDAEYAAYQGVNQGRRGSRAPVQTAKLDQLHRTPNKHNNGNRYGASRTLG